MELREEMEQWSEEEQWNDGSVSKGTIDAVVRAEEKSFSFKKYFISEIFCYSTTKRS
jgi:hypothetical protein